MHLNLRTSVVAAVIVGLLIPVTVSTLFTLRRQEQALEEQFSADQHRLAELLAQGIQNPLWNLNNSAAQPLIDSVLSDERVVSVVARDADAGIFIARELPERRLGKQVRLERKIVHENRTIGVLAIEMDTGRLDSAAANYRRIFTATVFAQLLLSLVLITAVLQLRLLGPLRQLMQQSERLAWRELTEPFIWRRADELGRLGRTLEATRRALAELFEALEAKNQALREDLEERLRIEKELKRHRDHLEEIVEQRTAELRRSNADLEQMAYVASHDLNEPLRMVASYLQLLEKRYGGQLDADAHEFIGYAVDGAKRMQALIAGLLAYSRLSSRAVSYQPVDCSTLLAAVVRSLRMSIQECGASVHFEGLPVVAGDATQIMQLFQNLVANAVKFRGDEAPVVRILAEREGRFWHFQVQDNGIGIEPEYANRVFEMFQRLHARHVYPGTGIGLSVCKKIVERHGGSIRVEPNPSGGCVFHFTLPALGEEKRDERSTSDSDHRDTVGRG